MLSVAPAMHGRLNASLSAWSSCWCRSPGAASRPSEGEGSLYLGVEGRTSPWCTRPVLEVLKGLPQGAQNVDVPKRHERLGRSPSDAFHAWPSRLPAGCRRFHARRPPLKSGCLTRGPAGSRWNEPPLMGVGTTSVKHVHSLVAQELHERLPASGFPLGEALREQRLRMHLCGDGDLS